MKRILKILTIFLMAGVISGCAGMTDTQQRVLSGGAIGAGTGAAVGVLSGGSGSTGAIIGGAAGAAGGYIFDQSEKKKGR